MNESKSGPGRNFEEISQNIEYASDRKNAMHPGDYIAMPKDRFEAWLGPKRILGPSDKIIDEKGLINVRILAILDRDKIEVEGNGVRDTVDGSLFYNFKRNFPH